MIARMAPNELEDALFLAMLNMSRANAGPEFDLVSLCDELRINADSMQLITFTADNEGLRGTRNNTVSKIRFTMNAEGLRHALELEQLRQPVTWRSRAMGIPRSDWIAIAAVLISLIAVFK